ncbi:phage holin family protein [Marinilactibacillus psychrotolerans]|uniref:phage holin family protein n=1 Tax=Marinilactibacillus psychrotolerans TaxID=191770 RepID=UPI0038898904
MDILQFILEEGLVMVPVLFVLGEIIKQTTLLDNRFIPVVLLVVSILLTPWLLGGFVAMNIVQAILVTGAAVLTNEFTEQYLKGGE